MALKRTTSVNVTRIKEIKLRDVIVNDNDTIIEFDDMYQHACDGELCYIDINGKNHSIVCEIDELPYCCGVMEIGNLGNIDFISQKAFNVLIKGILYSDFAFTIIINDEKGPITWTDKLTKCKMFTLVKTFNNPNSNKTLNMWVSNTLK